MDISSPLSSPDSVFIYLHGWNTSELNSHIALVPISKSLQPTKKLQDRWGKGIRLISKMTRVMVTDWFCVGGKRSCFLDYYQSSNVL